MKIYKMTATFGKLEHAELTLQPGLNILTAPNEWGKSTWCAFLVARLKVCTICGIFTCATATCCLTLDCCKLSLLSLKLCFLYRLDFLYLRHHILCL